MSSANLHGKSNRSTSESTAAKHARQANNKFNHQYLLFSNAMRTYIDSLPEKLTITEELSEYQFWKSLRTEFIATFLFIIFTTGTLSISYKQPMPNVPFENISNNNSWINSEQSQLKNALSVGLTVATLVQCTGHVCGCHLSIAITIGLYVSGRVSPLRLASYLLVQCLASILALIVVHNLFGLVMPIRPSYGLTPSQIFGFEFLATLIIVLTYLANCDQHRRDLGFKALSIGFAYTVGHLFAFIATGASLNPAKAMAIAFITGQYCLHWIYWISPLIAGLFGGLIYEYIGSIKPPEMKNRNNHIRINCNCNCNNNEMVSTISTAAAELRHQFNYHHQKKRKLEEHSGINNCHSVHSIIANPEAPFDDETEFSTVMENELKHQLHSVTLNQ